MCGIFHLGWFPHSILQNIALGSASCNIRQYSPGDTENRVIFPPLPPIFNGIFVTRGAASSDKIPLNIGEYYMRLCRMSYSAILDEGIILNEISHTSRGPVKAACGPRPKGCVGYFMRDDSWIQYRRVTVGISRGFLCHPVNIACTVGQRWYL